MLSHQEVKRMGERGGRRVSRSEKVEVERDRWMEKVKCEMVKS